MKSFLCDLLFVSLMMTGTLLFIIYCMSPCMAPHGHGQGHGQGQGQGQGVTR